MAEGKTKRFHTHIRKIWGRIRQVYAARQQQGGGPFSELKLSVDWAKGKWMPLLRHIGLWLDTFDCGRIWLKSHIRWSLLSE